MKTIFRIARAELRNLFYSPVAWFLAVVFLIQCAVFYSNTLYQFAKAQELSLKVKGFKGFDTSVTNRIYLMPDGMFSNVMMNLYLFIPLITMGILSREVSSGSIKLLYSSPVKTRQIVLGKYLSIMIFNLLLVSIVGIFLVSGAFNIQHADIGLMLSAALGFYLLVCAYAAIGLFMSSLTTYQIVSALGTFIVIFILSRIGSLWQDIDFVRDLSYFLSISGRTEQMLMGLITTKDLFYFLVVIGMFIGFTLLKLRSGRESKARIFTLSKYLAIIIGGLVIGYMSSRPALVGYLDTTNSKSNTIHPNVQKIVKDLGNEPLEVTLYTNLLGLNAALGFPQERNNYLTGLWEKYQRFKPDITYKYEYYYDAAPDSRIFKYFPGKSIHEIAKEFASRSDLDLSKFKTPAEMKKIIDLGPEDYNLVMQLKYKGRTTFLRTYPMMPWPDQPQVAAAFARLLNQQMPKVLFTTGNLERSPDVRGERGFSGGTSEKLNRGSLINNGFDIDSLSLDNGEIPYGKENIAMLILADPKTELSTVKKQRLQQYIDNGGNILILGEPGKEDLINPILKPLGVQLDKGTLIHVTKDYTPDLIQPYLTDAASRLADENKLIRLRDQSVDSIYVVMESVTPILYNDSGVFKIQPLLKAMPQAWLKRGKFVKDSVPPMINLAEGDYHTEPFIGAVSITRKINNKEQRIIVAGDADFMSNKYFISQDYLVRGMYSWLDLNKYPVYGPVPMPKDNLLNTVPKTASVLKIIYIWIFPATLLLLGAIILIRRKRK